MDGNQTDSMMTDGDEHSLHRKHSGNGWLKKIDHFFKKIGGDKEKEKEKKSPEGPRKGPTPDYVSSAARNLSVLTPQKREEMQAIRERVVQLKEQMNACEMAIRTIAFDGMDRRRHIDGRAAPIEPTPGASGATKLEKRLQELGELLAEAENLMTEGGRELHQLLLASKKINSQPIPGLPEITEEEEHFLYGWEIDPSEWRCIKKLGEGEFGITFQAEFRGRSVAVKKLKVQFPNSKLIEESKQELRLLSRLRNPNIVMFMGACTSAEDFCVVTELMEGGSLFDLLHKQQKQLDKWMVIQWAQDIAYGMAYLHRQTPQIIHRDLKSGNLLINKYLHLKIADFGLARVKADSGIMTAETGSYRWMAPEVIRHEKYNEKVDVYSFALVVWEMLTGSMPFLGYSPVQAAMAVARQGARPEIPQSVSPRMASLIERCWASNPNDRPDFETVLRMLDEIEKEMIIEQARSAPGGRAAKSI